MALFQISISQQILNEHLAPVKLMAAKGTKRVSSPWFNSISLTHRLHTWPEHCQNWGGGGRAVRAGKRVGFPDRPQIHLWALRRPRNSWNYWKFLLMYLDRCIFSGERVYSLYWFFKAIPDSKKVKNLCSRSTSEHTTLSGCMTHSCHYCTRVEGRDHVHGSSYFLLRENHL